MEILFSHTPRNICMSLINFIRISFELILELNIQICFGGGERLYPEKCLFNVNVCLS